MKHTRNKSHWLKVHVPQMILWSVFGTLAISFFAERIGTTIGASLEKEIAKLSIAEHAAYGGPSNFPSLGCTIEPFGFSPNWGGMKTNAALQRTFCAMSVNEFVPPPPYNISRLKTPLKDLDHKNKTSEEEKLVTEKLFYSTRYLGEKNLDSGEFVSLSHPAIDIKMPLGTPVRAIAGGRVNDVGYDETGLGNYVIIEHKPPHSLESLYSIYGHLEKVIVTTNTSVRTGQFIGTVGSTGNSTLPHLHLQIDRARDNGKHVPYVPSPESKRSDIMRWTMHPIDFLEQYKDGSMSR